MAALAEFDREAIVEGTLEGLASARARGRVGGRRPKLTPLQLDQAQQMYDSGKHTVEEIAAAFHVRRSTLYRYLSAGQDGPDCALVVYRNTRPARSTPARTAGTARPAGANPSSSKPTVSGGPSHPSVSAGSKGWSMSWTAP